MFMIVDVLYVQHDPYVRVLVEGTQVYPRVIAKVRGSGRHTAFAEPKHQRTHDS